MGGRVLTGVLVLAAAPLMTGCSTTSSNTAKGAGIGGLLGAGTGAAIGSASGNTGKGAVIGGLIGAGVGGLVGNEADRQEKFAQEEKVRRAEARAEAAAQMMTVDDVIRLTRSQTPESVIINQIRSTQSVFQLTTADLETLGTNNVSPNVILEMQNRRPGPVPYPYRGHRYPPPVPVIVVPGPPPPPPGFHVGVAIP